MRKPKENKHLSPEARENIYASVAAGENKTVIARRFTINHSTF